LTLTPAAGSDDAVVDDAEHNGHVVVVTGAGTGIGRATARAFAAEGANVLAVGRRPGPLAATAAGDHRIAPLAADVTGEREPERIVRAALDRWGRVDVAVNNAGIAAGDPLEATRRTEVESLLATNLVAPMLLARAALPALDASGGVVVNVGTAMGQRGWPGNAAYAASKAALDALTRSWAVELAPRGVRVVAVAPGAVDTPIGEHRGLSPTEMTTIREWQVARTPLGRLTRPEEVAWAIMALASPRRRS
jgi:NAD(P)-dependent dehydrogenase (short-subunit alcohol dehydrogenase family)